MKAYFNAESDEPVPAESRIRSMKVRHHKKNSFTNCIIDDNLPENRRSADDCGDDGNKSECRPVPSSGGGGRLCEGPGYLGG
jgi:hypothetical protein